MLFLLGSILLSGFLTIAFKFCDRYRINKFQAIVCNYAVCTLTGSIFSGSLPSFTQYAVEPWFKWSLLMGLFFIASFNLIALTVQKSGLAIAAVASKTSLVIPFLFSVLLYGEEVSAVTVAGIVLAIVAVVLTVWPGRRSANEAQTRNVSRVLLPIAVFAGTGLLDALIKYVELSYISESNNNAYLINTFAVAFLVGLLFLLYKLATGAQVFQPKAVLAGIIIGIPNYFSIWCLMKVLKQYSSFSSVIIPVNNMGIVLLSAMVAWLFFHEKLTRHNWLGIALSIIAVLLIALNT